MKTQLISCLFAAAIAGGVSFYSPPAVERGEAAEFDFTTLHNEAASALQTLRASLAGRLALPQIDEF
jgi:hypothetical protein